MELSKYFKGIVTELKRSEISMAPYNPRKATDSAKKKLKENIKNEGLLGGLVWNKTTGNLVSGHQRVGQLDVLHKYDGSPDSDYILRVEMVEMTLAKEKAQNTFFNNKNAQGSFDDEAMRKLMQEDNFDFRAAGMDEIDLSYYGISQKEDARAAIADVEDAFSDLMAPVEKSNEDKKEHVKNVKAQVAAAAKEKAEDGEAFFMISFDNFQNKVEFMERFGFDPMERHIKGEEFSQIIERIDYDEE